MELWSGAFGDFQEDTANGSLFATIEKAFRKRYGCLPGESEQRSWQASLTAVADSIDLSRPEDVNVAVEYHLPLSGQRIDAIFFGRSEDKTAHALIVELKQWSDAQLGDEFSENVIVDGSEHVHPSQQAFDYASFLADYHSAFVEDGLFARSCALCHNIQSAGLRVLTEDRFDRLLRESPLFTGTQSAELSAFVDAHVCAGDGAEVMERVRCGRFKPSQKVIQRLEQVIKQDDRWTLLDTQRKAYNTIMAHVRRAH
jgi:hypothetical protein